MGEPLYLAMERRIAALELARTEEAQQARSVPGWSGIAAEAQARITEQELERLKREQAKEPAA